MDSLENDLSLSCAFHKNEVTTNRRWLLPASRMCNLCGELRLPLILHNAKHSRGCVSTGSPGAFWHQESYLSVQPQWWGGIAGFPLQALSWLRSQPSSWGHKAMFFPRGCFLYLSCSAGVHLSIVIMAGKYLTAALEKDAREQANLMHPFAKGWVANEVQVSNFPL